MSAAAVVASFDRFLAGSTNKFQYWSPHILRPSWKLSNRHLDTDFRIVDESRKIA